MGRWGVSCFNLSPPWRVKSKHCLACGTMCEVKRNQYGPTSFLGAMGGRKHYHDHFRCPYSDEEWHEQAVILYWEAHECKVPTLKRIIEGDLAIILEKNMRPVEDSDEVEQEKGECDERQKD